MSEIDDLRADLILANGKLLNMVHEYFEMEIALQDLYDEIRSRFASGQDGFKDMTNSLRSVMERARIVLKESGK